MKKAVITTKKAVKKAKSTAKAVTKSVKNTTQKAVQQAKQTAKKTITQAKTVVKETKKAVVKAGGKVATAYTTFKAGGYKEVLSVAADFIPVVGNVKSAYEAIVGKDPITGRKLEDWERAVSAAGILGGPTVKAFKHGGKLFSGVMKSTSPVVTNNVGKLTNALEKVSSSLSFPKANVQLATVSGGGRAPSPSPVGKPIVNSSSGNKSNSALTKQQSSSNLTGKSPTKQQPPSPSKQTKATEVTTAKSVKQTKGTGKSLDSVPSVRNGEFSNWFNSLTTEEFDRVWSDPKLREKIKDRLRHPGGMHEWHLVSRADTFKYWGVTAEQIVEMRTLITDTKFVNPTGKYGGKGSTKAHNELLQIIDTSEDYDMFKRRLQNWSDYRFEGGSDALPDGLKPNRR